MTRVLYAEDDPQVVQMVQVYFDRQVPQWTLDIATCGRDCLAAMERGGYDLLLLDLGLPKKDGLDVLKTLRHRGNRIPVLILTARDTVADRVKGLDAGADDYLVKPFDLDELAARIRALLRRQSGRAEPAIQFGDLRLNPATHEVTFQGKPLSLSAREFSLLEVFLDRPGMVLSREQLEEKLYGWGEEVESNTVEVYIHALRRKLGQEFIKNVRGVGYMVPKRS